MAAAHSRVDSVEWITPKCVIPGSRTSTLSAEMCVGQSSSAEEETPVGGLWSLLDRGLGVLRSPGHQAAGMSRVNRAPRWEKRCVHGQGWQRWPKRNPRGASGPAGAGGRSVAIPRGTSRDTVRQEGRRAVEDSCTGAALGVSTCQTVGVPRERTLNERVGSERVSGEDGSEFWGSGVGVGSVPSPGSSR